MQFDRHKYDLAKYSDLIPCICKNCLQDFFTTKRNLRISLLRNQKNLFCSKLCLAEFQTSEERKNYDKKCLQCQGEAFFPNKFCSQSCAATYNNQRKIKKIKPSKKNNPQIQRDVKCCQCKLPITRSSKNKTKHDKEFCSKSCRMKYFNIHFKINSGSSINKSFPEEYLSDKISSQFTSLEIQKNNRIFLKCGYEIDILMPSINLAIEVNGPVHYMPIFGEDKLNLTQYKDAVKYAELNSRGVSFLIVDVSMSISKKRMAIYLDNILKDQIYPLIEEKLRKQDLTDKFI